MHTHHDTDAHASGTADQGVSVICGHVNQEVLLKIIGLEWMHLTSMRQRQLITEITSLGESLTPHLV